MCYFYVQLRRVKQKTNLSDLSRLCTFKVPCYVFFTLKTQKKKQLRISFSSTSSLCSLTNLAVLLTSSRTTFFFIDVVNDCFSTFYIIFHSHFFFFVSFHQILLQKILLRTHRLVQLVHKAFLCNEQDIFMSTVTKLR